MIYLLHSIGELAQNVVKLIATIVLYPFSFIFGKLLDAAENHGVINETVSEMIMLLIFLSVVILIIYAGYLIFKYSLFLLIVAYFSSVLFGVAVIVLVLSICYYLWISRGYQLKTFLRKFIRHENSAIN